MSGNFAIEQQDDGGILSEVCELFVIVSWQQLTRFNFRKQQQNRSETCNYTRATMDCKL